MLIWYSRDSFNIGNIRLTYYKRNVTLVKNKLKYFERKFYTTLIFWNDAGMIFSISLTPLIIATSKILLYIMNKK